MRNRLRLIVGALVGVGLVAFATSYNGRAGGLGNLGLSIAPAPDGAPVIITASLHKNLGAFSLIEVQNVSKKAVQSIAFGVLVYGKDNAAAAPSYFPGKPIETSLPPGRSGELTADLLPRASIIAIVQDHPAGADLHVGITRVEFVDGSDWVHDAKTLGRFGERRQASSSCGSWFSRALSAFQGGYKCDPSDNRERCSVAPNGQSCTNYICEAGPGCPSQKCAIIEPD